MIFRPGGGTVYRVMRNRGCFEYPATVRVEAFLRREIAQPDGTWVKKDSKGVSVAGSETSVFAEITPKGIAGIESMILRQIRNPRTQEALEIIADPPTKERLKTRTPGLFHRGLEQLQPDGLALAALVAHHALVGHQPVAFLVGSVQDAGARRVEHHRYVLPHDAPESGV